MQTTKAMSALVATSAWDPVSLWTKALDLPRQQLAAAVDTACAMFSGSEAMRSIQQRAAHEALQRHGVAAEKLKGRCTPLEVMAVQLDLTRSDLEGALAYWQQLFATMVEMQARMAACGCEFAEVGQVPETKPRQRMTGASAESAAVPPTRPRRALAG
ncbi:MAG TPA: phasin family protein [Ramlibacter sp.]|nr:phasin family protein [Ramlibacter sp.]